MRAIRFGGRPVLPAAHRMGNSAHRTATGPISNTKRVFVRRELGATEPAFTGLTAFVGLERGTEFGYALRRICSTDAKHSTSEFGVRVQQDGSLKLASVHIFVIRRREPGRSRSPGDRAFVPTAMPLEQPA